MWLLILQQVQAVRVHHSPPPKAPDRGLRQALLRATSPCRFPWTSMEGDTNAIYRFLEHAWPPCSHSCRDATFLLHPFIPTVNVLTTGWGFLVSYTDWSFHCSRGTKFSKEQKKSVSSFLLSRHDQHLYPLVAQMRTPTFKRDSSTQASGKEGEYRDCHVNQRRWYAANGLRWTGLQDWRMPWDTRGAFCASVRLGTNWEISFIDWFRLHVRKKLLSCFRLHVRIIPSYWVINFLRCSILFEPHCINFMKYITYKI